MSTNEPITLASGLSGPNLLTVDQDNVYWTENKYSANSWIVSVKKVSLSGGTVNTIGTQKAGSGGEGGTGIVVDNNSVYWGVNPGYGNGNIYKMPKSGGTITELAEANQPYDIEVDDAYVYWAEYNSGGADGVRKVSINGGSVTSLTTSGTFHGVMTMDSTYIYFRYIYNEKNKIGKVSKDGGSVSDLATNLTNSPSGMAVDENNVYWIEQTAGTVKKVPINGGTITSLTEGLNYPYRIAVDSNSVYWTEYAEGTIGVGAIRKYQFSSGEVITLASGLNGPYDIVIDDYYVYWTEKGTSGKDGTIKKIAIDTSKVPTPTPAATSTPTPEASPTSTEITTKVAAGGRHSLVIKSDGTVWAWGNNGDGQLGDGTATNRSTPIQVNDLVDVTTIDGGASHSLALKSDGTVWAWGNNGYGQLGNGATTNKAIPVQVNNLGSVIAIAGGDYHSLALKSDGTVWAWGRNGDGQLGDGTTTNRTTPVQVSNLSDVVAIARGWVHGLALKSDGTVWTWGDNGSGQLGDGTTTNKTTPVKVNNLSSITAITGGGDYTVALKSDGTIWLSGEYEWDYYENNGTAYWTYWYVTTPKLISEITNVTAIAGGWQHIICLKSDGTVWSWGVNWYGQLGDGTTTDRSTPVQVDINLNQTTTSTPMPEATVTLPPVPSPEPSVTLPPLPSPEISPTPTPQATPSQSPTSTLTPSVTPTPTTTPEEEDLLKKYAPILYMHTDERFYPANAQTMLNNSELWKKGKLKGKLVYKNNKSDLKLKHLKIYNENKYYLKLKGSSKNKLKDNKRWKKDPTIYGRKFKSDEDTSKTVLQYWFFYIYNEWGTLKKGGNTHEGDWEMVQIVLDSDKKPEKITYGFHHGGQTFEWDNELVAKDLSENHPRVYVTLGGHGCWNEPGDNTWYQEKGVCLKCIDETRGFGDVFYPDTGTFAESDALDKYTLLEISNSTDENSAYHWIHWKGYWGMQQWEKGKLGISGPKSPPYIDYLSNSLCIRWSYPFCWSDDPLPSSYTICTTANSKVIFNNLKGTSKYISEYCDTGGEECGKECSNIRIIYSEEDLVFDVYSLDGNEVDLKVSRYKRTGEVYDVEFEGLEIPRNGKASFAFSPEENPTFEIGIDRDRNDIIDSHRLPDFLEVK